MRKAKRRFGERGSQKEETAHKMRPRGSPGSFMFFLICIHISSPLSFLNFDHELLLLLFKLEEQPPTAWQKLSVILCPKFNILFLPATVTPPILHIYLGQEFLIDNNINQIKSHFRLECLMKMKN